MSFSCTRSSASLRSKYGWQAPRYAARHRFVHGRDQVEVAVFFQQHGGFTSLPARVAVRAVFVFLDAFRLVHHRHVRRLMIVAVVAGLFGEVLQVAGLAFQLFCAGMRQLEGVPGQFGWLPGDCCVAAGAVASKLASVQLGVCVAGHAILGRAGEDLFRMAFLAVRFGMSAF